MWNNAAFHCQISLPIENVEMSQIWSDTVPNFISIQPKTNHLKGTHECIMHAYITDSV